MKPTKMLICALAMGAVTFASSRAFALQGTITVSGTALSQDANNQDFDVVKKNSITQKRLLFLLEQATGDTSITNKPTKIIYDPDAFNDDAYFSNQGGFNVEGGFDFYGIFYYSNSVSGRVQLDGTTSSNNYYSYIELDYENWVLERTEGFWNPNTVEYNTIFADSKNKATGNGNAILYVHSDPNLYNLPNGNQIYANTWDDAFQQYALVFHGKMQFTQSFSNSNNNEQESFNLTGTGDGVWDFDRLVVNGTVKFTAKGRVPSKE